MFYNGHHIDKSMVNAPPGCKGQTTCLECTRPVCRYDKEVKEPKAPKEPKVLTCPVCGRVFEKYHKNQKYCSQKCYRDSRAEYKRAYYRKNCEKFRERGRAYYRAHRDRLLEYNRKYRHEHKGQIREYNRERYLKQKGER